MYFPLKAFLIFCSFLLVMACSQVARGQAMPERYGLPSMPEQMEQVSDQVKGSMDSLIRNHPQFQEQAGQVPLAKWKEFKDKTSDFYLLLLLILLLGLIRLSDPKYFHSLWLVFKNTSVSRQLNDKLQAASFPNLMMNFFFTLSAASYLFYLVKNFTPQQSSHISLSLLITVLIPGVMVIYLVKYAVVRFSGWVFRVENLTDHYLFNVFLTNKILGIALVPFILLMAFADISWARPAMHISILLVIILFSSRYLRSWQVFGSFFQYSKFHFFTYLCASELLPLAVLMKLLVRGLLY
jgi:hypothetical protein